MSQQINWNTNWRKVASTIYRKPVDSKLFGQSDIDVTELDRFMAMKRKEGVKITYTHIFTILLARCLNEETPQFNTYMKFGRVVPRPSIDVMISVLQADGSMGSVKVEQAHEKSLQELVQFLKTEIADSRKGEESHHKASKNLLAVLPWPFRGWFFSLYKKVVVDWGVSLGTNLSPNSFGSVILTNIGSIGLDTGYPALMPSSTVPLVFVLGGVKKKPVVINDEIVIRNIMTVSVAIDHRVADASHGGKLLKYIKRAIQEPEVYFESKS
ncbi:2-oxo acid dehydrogenase subunit E2 [Marinoscillum sp.]|uniref:2-oxo acid dehydrogenase subunit E2 n=1 Tax=Marinoscillum sp. TaxID=2024838 RepID=UPI003BAD925A